MSSRFSASGYGVLGDSDQSEFNFQTLLSDGELIELLERNPRLDQMCNEMAAKALKNGHTLPPGSEEHLQAIHFAEKEHRAIMFSRLHGAAMCKKIDAPIAPEEDEEGNITETITTNFEVYHRLGQGNGWFLKSDDIGPNGQPHTFHLTQKIEKGKSKTTIVPLSQCAIFKNPKKGDRWDGTPSSKMIAHTALLEELLIKLAGKHSIDIAGSFLHFDGITSEEQASGLHTALQEKPLNELYTNGVTIVPMNNDVHGAIDQLKIYDDMLKDYMAAAMHVSRQSMDGAPEGTLSSSDSNQEAVSDTIETIQAHFTPYIEELLELLGYPAFKLTWNKPMEVTSDKESKVNSEGSDTHVNKSPQSPAA